MGTIGENQRGSPSQKISAGGSGPKRPVDDFVAAQSLQVQQASTEGHRGQGNSGNRYCEQKAWVKLVGAAGLEPATLCLEGRCSIRLSYAPVPGVFSSILAGRGRYFPGTGSQPRVTKSLRLSTSRIPSHSIPPPTTTLVRMVLWRRCMKNSATSIIFTTAINSAMTTLNGPRSMVATTVVAAVRISSDRKTNV